jgi:hypothetical protein
LLLSQIALHLAAEKGYVKIVELLLQQKDVQSSAKDRHGNTPLLAAVKSKERHWLLQLLAPWNRSPSTTTLKHKIPVYNVLYEDFLTESVLSHKHVSTRPDPFKETAFRWIHMPTNNLHWCQTLLKKSFIEGDFSDNLEDFKVVERLLSQQQYRGRRRDDSRFMRPTCSRLLQRFSGEDQILNPLYRNTADVDGGVDLPLTTTRE